MLEMLTPEFKKSSFSGNGGCVAIALDAETGNILFADFKDMTKPPLDTITPEGWAHFMAECKNGEFDL